jgi:competence protein ComEA
MEPRFRDYFTFTARERNGTIVLVALIAFLVVFLSTQDKFVSLPKENFSEFDAFIAQLEKNKTQREDSAYVENAARPPSIADEAGTHSIFHKKEKFYFNPNNLPVDDWVKLGLSPGQAHVVKNFEAKGGTFKTKEDVKKLFVISGELYLELEPFIVIPEKVADNNQKVSAAPNPPRVIELNTADSADLVLIDGIGPVFAKRIISYRERLGGYYAIDQLLEVFGIDNEHFEKIRNSVKADSTYIRKINVNTAAAGDLKKHPYIGPGVAQALVNYRKQHGPFKQLADIRKCDLVSADLYRKIAPYLTT